MKFSMKIKWKNAICNKNKVFFHKIKTYMNWKMQYLLSQILKNINC